MHTDNMGVKLFFLLFDLLLLNLSVFMVYHFSPIYEYIDLPGRDLYFLHANICELFAYVLYSKRNYFFTDKYLYRVKAFSIRFIILLITIFLLAEIFLPKDYYRGFLLEYVAFFYILKVVVFYFIYKYHQFRYKKGYTYYRVAILGIENSSRILGKLLNNNPALGFRFVGYISNNEDCSDCPVLGELDNLSLLSEKFKLNMLFVTNPKYFTKKRTNELLTLCNETGVRVRYILTNGYWNSYVNKRIESSGFFEMFNPQEIPLDNLNMRIEKRIFDVFFSTAIILLVFSWLFLIIGIFIKIDSKGPVFFLQNRTGINNKTFKCFKFRTMTVNNEADSKQAEVNDSRITAIGNILRRSNIDELPQFFNVFLGNMSVVGPRPHMLKHTEQYSALIKYYKVRHFVKPGITGWAQVNGYRGLTDELWKMEKRVEYDMEYLEKWNFFWDIKIIIMTVFGNSAYKNAM